MFAYFYILLNKSCLGSRCGMSMLFWGRSKTSPILAFKTPNLTSGYIRQPSSIRHSTSRSFFIFLFFLKTLFIELLFLQLEIVVFKLFDVIIFDFFRLWKRFWIWSLCPHIRRCGGWWYGRFVSLESSSLRMGFGKVNLGNNNLGVRKLSNGCCTCIPTCLHFHSVIILHFVLNLWQISFECVLVHIGFLKSPQSFPYFWHRE